MPFTFSHPAVVVPLTRAFKNKVSVTGLAVGSMMPDIEYFIRMEGFSEYGHTWDGILWFDVPIGILVACIFHNFVRNSFINHLPAVLRSRLQGLLYFNWNRWIATAWLPFIICLAVGSASHILWDGFTHEVANWLRTVFGNYNGLDEGEDFFIYYLFFAVNSIFGLWLLIVYTARLPMQPLRIVTGKRYPYWSVASMIALGVLIIRVLTGGDLPFLSYIDSAISALMIGILAASLHERFKR